MKNKIISAFLATVLTASLIAGCTDKKDGDGNTTTTATTSAEITTLSPDEELRKKEEAIKKDYLVTGSHAELLKEEKTDSPILYGGFSGQYYSTPAKADGLPLASVVPIYSYSSIEKYIEENKDKYDLGTFTEGFAKYDEAYFETRSLLAVSFKDADGGSDYKIMGAWENHLHVEDMHLDQLVLAIKKAPGEDTAGHMIIEVDNRFIALWDSITVSLYE